MIYKGTLYTNVFIYKTVSRTITYNTEREIAKHTISALKVKCNTWNIDTSQYKKVDTITLTNEQMKTLDMVFKNSISILNGSAGTGKSSSILGLINLLKDNKKSFFVSAPTGRAAPQCNPCTLQQKNAR